MRTYLANWPGKSADAAGREHPAVYHMLDVAAVAEHLLPQADHPPALREALTLLIALHDLGKIGSGFRAMIQGLSRQHEPRHWELTEAWLWTNNALPSRLRADGDAWRELVAAIAGHHGRPSAKAPQYFGRQCASAGAEAGQDILRVIDDLAALWPAASLAGLSQKEAACLSWWLCGATVAADWVGSNPEWFPARAPDLDLPDYLAVARVQAARAVKEAGLNAARLREGALFDFPLRPMQAAARDIALPAGPMLAFIEDETGAGKTEAAFILAQRMLRAGKGRGLYLALPTMATADAMFARARTVIGRLFEAPSLTLAHGRAALSNPFRDLVGGRSGSDDVVCAPWLADSRRRALLADVGVGTVDQALLAVLPTRFSTLRLWGLASKILIVDEAHEISGDHYMAELLAALLRAHAAHGGSAILLTATLPLKDRATLTRAFADGAGRDWAGSTDRHYPALTIPGGGTWRETASPPSPKGPVKVVRLATALAAIDRLVEAAGQGAACVFIRNAVDEAIAAAEALQARGVPVSLLHARFALCDRKRIEAQELARFGRNGDGRAGRVLVASTIVQTSLDLDMDFMISDLAPVAALIQRAGRLWRHMEQRPRAGRPMPEPVLHVLSPDPADVRASNWLSDALGRGAFVYPLADQWRTADVLFRAGVIDAPHGLRDLIEAVHGQDTPVPPALEAAELDGIGQGYAKATRADQNRIDFAAGYRAAGAGADDEHFPTRLGRETRTLVLARRLHGALVPWAEGHDASSLEGWMLSEVQAYAARLARLTLPDQTAPEIAAVKRDWPDWRKASTTICPVGEDGAITQGLRYDPRLGLLL